MICRFVLATLLLPCLLQANNRPNIVVILTDDQGWGDLSVNGNTNLSTPNIDSLARDGVLFDRFYVCPVCSPTRAEFLTGRYFPRGGVRGVTLGGERLNLDEKTIADVFKSAGYKTGVFGKWHNGTQYPYHPIGRGFDEFYGFTSGHWGDYFDPMLDHNGQIVTGRGYLPDDATDRAIAFIESSKDSPFFCYVPFNTPHSPMQVPDRFHEKFANADIKLRGQNANDENVAFTRAALAMCENIDWNVGRILKRLDEMKLAENTIVLYFSDNGPNNWRWNGGMKGRKGSTDEGGVRSPLLVRWPGRIPAGVRIEQIAGAIDLLPTLADCAGITLKPGKPLDGVSLKPLLTGNASDWPDRKIFSHWNNKTSVRTQRFRLDNDGVLFDIPADPGQRRDVSREHPAVTAALSRAIAAWKQDVLPGASKDTRPFPVGHAEFPITQLPARDGIPHGNIRRSAEAPNCSYFTNWTSVGDRITWDIEVASAGTYEVTVYYTCAPADVGATVELSFNDSRIATVVSEANDPPQVGAAHDRVARESESYVKDFKPFPLGTIALTAARGKLALRASNIPGREAMDVRMLVLTLKTR